MELFPNLDPEELRLTALLCLSGFIFVAGLYIAGRILTRKRHDSVIPIALVIGAMLVIGAAVSIYLDTRPSVPGVVVSKREHVATEPDGTWEYGFYLNTQYTPPGEAEPRTNELRADQPTYDRVTAGDAVAVRYWDAGGAFEFARLADRSTFKILRQSGIIIPAFIIGLCVLFGMVVAAATRNKVTGILYGMGAIVAVIFSLQVISQWLGALPLGEPQATAVATIRDIRLYTEIRSSEDDTSESPLLQPFELVEVEFVPESWPNSVIALDRIDAGSLSLEEGGTVTIAYRTDRPRDVRIQGGSRTYLWKNPIFFVAMLAGIALVGIFLISRRRWMNRQPPRQAGDEEEVAATDFTN